MGSLFGVLESETRLLGSIRHVFGQVRKVASKLGGLVGVCHSAVDTTCDRLSGLDRIPALVRGCVIRSGIGSYDCEVDIGDGHTVVCSTLSPILHDTYGVSQACMPLPGSLVLVYAPDAGLTRRRVSRGVILGVLPEHVSAGASADGTSTIKKIADTEFPEGGVAQFTEGGPRTIATDKSYQGKGDFQFGRPLDLVPGEYALTSHSGAGLVIGSLSAEIRGSGAAGVRCSSLDDQVRISSGHFRNLHAAGGDEIFNDGGFVTCESFVTLYQPERLGVSSFGQEAFKARETSLLSAAQKTSGISPLLPTQTAKKRLYVYKGYLGDIVNVFVGNPDPDTTVEDMLTDHSPDQGLFHSHLDSSGRLTVRSASGILLERYDRIPIPRRRHYAWDPSGDRETEPEDKPGFIVPDKYPMAGGLVLGDMAAWYDHTSYARFRQFTKDFTVAGQADLKVPDSDYDRIGKGREEFAKYDTRHSYVSLTPDGGIVLRDAWGSEIVMADGRITFNAAANIEIRSGSSVIVLGGDDVVMKAYNSVDVSATKKDVRVKAEGNMQLVSMTRGVLVQSKAKGDSADWKRKGEELQSTGVVIKADESSVAVVGRKASVQGSDGVSLSSFDDGGSPSGSVILSGRQVLSLGSEGVVATARGTSGLAIYEQSAAICGPTVLLAGGQSAATAAGDKMLVGIPVDAPNMYSTLISACRSYAQSYLDSTEWLSPVQPRVFSQIDFRYRTTQQYGTDRDSGISGGSFSVYEPSWVALTEAGRKLMQACRLRAWDEGTDAEGEYPWPGKSAMQGSAYITFRERNTDGNGIEKAVSHEAQLTPTSFNSYHIRQST